MLHLTLVCIWATLWSGIANGSPSDGPVGFGIYAAPVNFPPNCTGDCRSFNDNTIIRRRTDQQIFRYVVAQQNGTQPGEGQSDIFTYIAPSLSGPWTLLPGIFLPDGPTNPIGDSSDSTWSPDVHLINGTYILLYTDKSQASSGNAFGQSIISYATSKDCLPKSYTDHGSLDIPMNHTIYSLIGANLFEHSDPAFLVFGSDNNGMYGVNMTLNPFKVISQPQIVIKDENLHPPPPIGVNNQRDTLSEGAFQYRADNGKMYIFFSRGHCCPEASDNYNEVYRIEVCRADTPWSTYFNQDGDSCTDGAAGSLFMESHGNVWGPGSVGVHDDPAEGTIIHYQYIPFGTMTNASLDDAMFGWNHISFDSGWPLITDPVD